MKKIFLIAILSLAFTSSTFAADRYLPGITIINRTQRGANEYRRYTILPYAERKAAEKLKSTAEMQELEESNYPLYLKKQEESYITSSRNEYLFSKYSDEQRLDTSIYDVGLNHLSRPQSYHYAKNKIIVHHTASDTSLFTGALSAISYMQDVYKNHLSRFGDIGYNFLIDPYGNIYEGRAGGDSVVGAHVSWNNTPSIGISLMGNFEVQKPTDAAIKSLTALVTALSKKYSIDPLAKTDYHIATTVAPYIKSNPNYRIAGHKDGGITACPGDNLYALLPNIRNAVWANLQNGILVKSVSVDTQITGTINGNTIPAVQEIPSRNFNNPRSTDVNILKNWTSSLDKSLSTIKTNYSVDHGVKPATTKTKKIPSQISLETARKLVGGNINVLLYDLSTNYTKWNISCDTSCLFVVGSKKLIASVGEIKKLKGGYALMIDGQKYSASKIIVADTKGGLVTISNYSRVSYAKIPRNIFHGVLTFGQESVKNLKTSKYTIQTAIVNTLKFNDYLRGIAETNDTESLEKIKVIQLISKGYALFYLNGKNKHPSIPVGATYNAIDDPNSFQKYVGAGLEKTLTKVYTQMEITKNQLVTYNGYLPILPYFSCSAGFTRSGGEKRGRTDTPYIVSRIDPVACNDFEGHGVGLSGKGAQHLSLQGRTAEEILKYYYPGIIISSL